MSRKIHLLWGVPGSLIVLVLLLLTAPFLLIRLQGVRDWAVDHAGLSAVLARGQRVRVEEVVRFDPAGLRLRGVRLDRQTPTGWETWARFGTVAAVWQPVDLLSGRIIVSSLRIDSVRVDLRRMPDPWLASPPEKKKSPGVLHLPAIRCSSVSLESLLVRGPGARTWTGDVELRRLSYLQGAVEGALDHAGFRIEPDSLELRLCHGRVRGDLAGAVELDSLLLSGDGLEALLTGGWSRSQGDSLHSSRITGRLALARFLPFRLPSLRRLPLPLQAEDVLRGELRVEGLLAPGAAPHGELVLALSGKILGQSLDTLAVRIFGSPDSLSLRELALRSGELQLQGEGEWAVPAKSASARLHFSGLDLSRPPLTLAARNLPRTRLSGEVAAQARNIGPGLRLAADLACDPGMILDRTLSGFTARAELDSAFIRVQELRTSGENPPALALSGSLDRRRESVELAGRLSRLPLAAWVAPWLRLPLEGEVSGPFQASGPLRHLAVGGDLALRRFRVEEVNLDTLDLGGIRGTLAPLRISSSLRAAGCDIYKIPLDSIRGNVRLADTISAALSAWRDTLALDLRGRVRAVERGTVWLDSARVRLGAAPQLVLARPARLDFSPEQVRVDSVRLQSSAGSLSASGWLNSPRARARSEGAPGEFGLRVAIRELHLGELVEFLGQSSENIDGLAEVDLTGSGTMEAPSFDFRAGVNGGHTFGWLWHRIDLAGAARSLPAVGGSSGEVLVALDSLRASSLGFIGEGGAGAERIGPEVPGRLIRLQADSLRLSEPRSWKQTLALLPDSLFTLLRQAGLGGRISLEDLTLTPILSPLVWPRIQKGARPSFAAPLDPMAAAIRVVRPEKEAEAERKASGVGGLVSLRARLGGSGAEPRVDLDLRGRNVHVFQASADSVRLDASYAADVLRVQDLDWYMGTARSHTEGTVPLHLSADPRRIAWGPGSWDLRTEIPAIDLSLASLVTSLIQNPQGTLSGHIRLTGAPPRLVPLGELTVAGGAFRIPGREERLTQVQASLQLDSSGVNIKDAQAALNETGKITARGFFHDDKHFSLTATARNAPVFETGNYRFTADGDFQAQPTADGDTLRPQLRGTVRVQDGLIVMDLAKPPPPGPVPYTPWLIDLAVSVPGSIKVNQPAAVADVGEGDMRVSFRWPYWNLGGQLQILDGRYRVYNRSFKVISGKVEFQDIGKGPRPILTAQAETYIAGLSEGERIHVIINVSGPPEELTITVSGSSKELSPNGREYSQTELIELMVGGGQLSNAQIASFTNPTKQYVSTELVNQVERQLVELLPYADRVQLLMDPGSDTPMRINVTPIVQPQWSVNYAQDLTASPGREVSLRYRLSNLLYLNATVDRNPKTGTEAVPVDKYSLDLKYRIEY